MKIAVVLNGEPPSADLLRAIQDGCPVYAGDGGALACLAAGVTPVLTVGDFDSLKGTALPPDWRCIRDEDQNSTDFEKILRRLPREMSALAVLGGLGGRLDHTWNNLILASALREDMRVCFLSDRETVWRITPQCPLALELPPGGTVSLLPVGRAGGIDSEGLEWELNQTDLGPGAGLSQSNRSTGRVKVSLLSGVLYFVAQGYPEPARCFREEGPRFE